MDRLTRCLRQPAHSCCVLASHCHAVHMCGIATHLPAALLHVRTCNQPSRKPATCLPRKY